jgi:hypothetical protein
MLFKENPPKVAVVILTYNCAELLSSLMPLIIENTPIDENHQLVFADNASTDNTVDVIKNDYPQIPLLTFEENYGFAEGYNKAIQETNCEYAVLLSCDVETAPGWLPPLLSKIESNPRIGAVQPKILSYHQRDEFEYAGASGGYLDILGFPFCRGRVFQTSEKDEKQYDDAKQIFWTGGCCFIVRREVYVELSGLDPDFFAHMEEIDLCWRMQNAGFEIWVEPQSQVYHIGGFKLNYNHPFKLYLNSRNNLSMLTKNLNKSTLIWLIPLRLLVDFLAAFYMLFTKGPNQFMAIVKGDFHYVKKLKFWLSKSNHQKSSMTDLVGVFNRSIIVSYFIRGKKRFSEIIQE